jgi:hypothetical protein
LIHYYFNDINDSYYYQVTQCTDHKCAFVGFSVNNNNKTNIASSSPFGDFDSTNYFHWISPNCGKSTTTTTTTVVENVKKFDKILIAGTSRTRTIYFDLADAFQSTVEKGNDKNNKQH